MNTIARLLVATSLAISPALANAQDLTKILTTVENVSVFGRYGGFLPVSSTLAGPGDTQHGLTGYGVELSYEVSLADTTSRMHYAVGLGYSQLGGFHSRQPSLDLRATVRELPAIAFYAIRSTSSKWYIPDPYLGLVTGLIRLQNAVGYKTDGSELLLSAEAFTVGGIMGLGFGSPVGSPFIEASYRRRTFPSLEYRETGGVTKVPDGWPRELNFSGWSVDVGLQMNIQGKKKEKPEERPRSPDR